MLVFLSVPPCQAHLHRRLFGEVHPAAIAGQARPVKSTAPAASLPATSTPPPGQVHPAMNPAGFACPCRAACRLRAVAFCAAAVEFCPGQVAIVATMNRRSNPPHTMPPLRRTSPRVLFQHSTRTASQPLALVSPCTITAGQQSTITARASSASSSPSANPPSARRFAGKLAQVKLPSSPATPSASSRSPSARLFERVAGFLHLAAPHPLPSSCKSLARVLRLPCSRGCAALRRLVMLASRKAPA